MTLWLTTGMRQMALAPACERERQAGQSEQKGLKVGTLRQRNPNWTRDELVVALDFYLRHRANPPAQNSEAIAGLSRNLNRIAADYGLEGDATLRNANGAYMKLMNFRSLDPLFTARGEAGLSRSGALDRQVWEGSVPIRTDAVWWPGRSWRR
jgi:hypothetical protein